MGILFPPIEESEGTMTIDEFLDGFREAHARWPFTVRGNGAIRCGKRCPLEMVARTRAGNWLGAARRLGCESDAHTIIHAADGQESVSTHSLALRARMLAIMAEPVA